LHAPAEQARRTRGELRRRGAEPFAKLHLVEAVALYKTGDREGAEAMADKVSKLASDRKDTVVARALPTRQDH
jgi:hypothetical protein